MAINGGLKMSMFRTLKADEIEVRVGSVKESGLSLLLFKDARCDMNVLDEVVGAFNWKREHSRDNANCTVSIWDKDKNQWVGKEDTGAESFTEKEKGLASDSFKRACFNWGIGRELYTAGFIWVNAKDCTIKANGQKFTTYDSFSVKSISYDSDKRINGLQIVNEKTKKVVFDLKVPNVVEEVVDTLKQEVNPVTLQDLLTLAESKKVTNEQLLAKVNNATPEKEHVTDVQKLTEQQIIGLYKLLGKVK